jgi:hypothetical protein
MERKDVRDVRSPEFYEREYRNWKAELDKAAHGLANWINSTTNDLDELRNDPETRDDYERISAMQDLVNRMLAENGDLPGVKSSRRPFVRKRADAAPGAHRAYR